MRCCALRGWRLTGAPHRRGAAAWRVFPNPTPKISVQVEARHAAEEEERKRGAAEAAERAAADAAAHASHGLTAAQLHARQTHEAREKEAARALAAAAEAERAATALAEALAMEVGCGCGSVCSKQLTVLRPFAVRLLGSCAVHFAVCGAGAVEADGGGALCLLLLSG